VGARRCDEEAAAGDWIVAPFGRGRQNRYNTHIYMEPPTDNLDCCVLPDEMPAVDAAAMAQEPRLSKLAATLMRDGLLPASLSPSHRIEKIEMVPGMIVAFILFWAVVLGLLILILTSWTIHEPALSLATRLIFTALYPVVAYSQFQVSLFLAKSFRCPLVPGPVARAMELASSNWLWRTNMALVMLADVAAAITLGHFLAFAWTSNPFYAEIGNWLVAILRILFQFGLFYSANAFLVGAIGIITRNVHVTLKLWRIRVLLDVAGTCLMSWWGVF
jgi:hypothetical protein